MEIETTGDLHMVTQLKVMNRDTNPRLHTPKAQALSTTHCGILKVKNN